ncbi:ParB N-terminal domain-containing protein [Dehalococcoidales bacterium]|nr:ParB N-terminal domain-containing protein [Dehalococcoidales bacterium]
MMRQYTALPIDKLISDVAVDPVHVRELADSIMVSGPISPVLVREENLALIDGFHRVAAMKELGFNQVECILSSCDEETFWDLRIMSATLHKAVTFARAVEWIEESFKASPWLKKHDSAYGLFQAVRRGSAPSQAQAWAKEKAKKWGISINTMIDWLYAKQSLAPELIKEVKQAGIEQGAKPYHYVEVATTLPEKPELQRQVIDKVKREELDLMTTRELAKAVRQARGEQEVKAILSRPFTKRAAEVVREVRAEQTHVPTKAEIKEELGLQPTPADQIMPLTQEIQKLSDMLDPQLYDWQGGRGLIPHVLDGLYVLIDKATKMIEFLERQRIPR